MSTTSSRFSVENFDPAPDEELVCSICRCVFDEPVECPCRHIFCRGCITNWLELKSSCPICRKRVFVMDIQQVVPLIKNMIAKLTLICPNRENGCKLKTNLESYNQHVSGCQHELIFCKNNNCTSALMRKDILKHQEVDCEFRTILCKKDCNLMLPLSKIKHHNCIKELKKQLSESSKREEALNKQVVELTNELNTLKKQSAEARPLFNFNPFRFDPTSLPSEDSSSSSFMDSFSSIISSDSDDRVTDSPPVLLRNLRSRLSYLDTLMSSLVNTSSEPLETENDQTAPSEPTRSINLTTDAIVSDSDDSLFHSSDNNRNSANNRLLLHLSTSDSSDSSNNSSVEEDELFPTPAQCRILKRKRSSAPIVMISSESESAGNTGPENRARRRSKRTQQNAASGSRTGNASGSASNVETENLSPQPTKSRGQRQARRNFPLSVVPIALSSDSVSSGSDSDKTSDSKPRANGLERTRELLELFTVETDPDWEPSVEETVSEGETLPNIRTVPAADLLDRMLSEEGTESSDNDCDVETSSNYEVLVPERTYDLLYRYVQEESDEDEEWIPKRNRH